MSVVGNGREVGKRKQKADGLGEVSVKYVDVQTRPFRFRFFIVGVCIDRDCEIMREGEWGGR